MINQYIEETYKDYDVRVKTFLSRVYEDVVNDKSNVINNYFYCCLDLLATQLHLYFMAIDVIEAEKSLSSEDSYKRVSKNPCIAILNHAHQEILNIMQKLSLSPLDKAKLNRLNRGEDNESAEELLNSLIE